MVYNVRKENGQFIITAHVSIEEAPTAEVDKSTIYDREDVQNALHEAILVRLDDCGDGLFAMLADATAKAEEHSVYGSHYFSYPAYQIMVKLSHKSKIEPWTLTHSELIQLAKALPFIGNIDSSIAKKIYNDVIDQLASKSYDAGILTGQAHQV